MKKKPCLCKKLLTFHVKRRQPLSSLTVYAQITRIQSRRTRTTNLKIYYPRIIWSYIDVKISDNKIVWKIIVVLGLALALLLFSLYVEINA